MPSFELYKRTLGIQGSKVGEVHKYNSDLAMEVTWDNDIQSRKAYIYDYYHDDQPRINKGMTYEDDTTKTPIDIKFIVTQYGSLSKDQVEYHIMFKPSQKISFTDTDDLYYYQTDFVNKYDATFPIGLYIDIPDDTGVYNKWLICSKEIGNQFIKYSVLPCNYEFMWVESNEKIRIKRHMWGAIRQQNSYNSGLWRDYYIGKVENQTKAMLPMNTISEQIFYTNDPNGIPTNMRMIISARTKNPITWQVSKVENTSPFGIQRLTFTQDLFDPNRDYIDEETGEMYADYFATDIDPIEEESPQPYEQLTCELQCATANIKAGGSYKLITAKFIDANGNDVTTTVAPYITNDSWTCSIDDEDVTDAPFITWKSQTYSNQIRIKFASELSYLTKSLIVYCTTIYEGETIVGEIPLDIIAV